MIEVVGYLGEPSASLREKVADADLVAGGRRHLDALNVPDERRIVLGPLAPALEALIEARDEDHCVVIASGDPNFYGIVRRLRLAGLHPHVTPAPSAVAMAFGAVGVPRDEAITVSAHGRDIRPALALIRTHPKVAVMTSAEAGVRELAAALPDRDRWFVLAERLGETDERVRVMTRAQAMTLTDVTEPNVVLVLTEHPDEMASAGISMPIAGQFTDRRNPDLVAPVAALAFAALLPGQGEICWVVGDDAQAVGTLAQANLACVLNPLQADSLVELGLRPDVVAASDVTPELLAVIDATPPRRIAAIGNAAAALIEALPTWEWAIVPTPEDQPHLLIGDRP